MLQRQHLFSVYLHPLPDFGTFPEESIFHGREIQERIQVWFLVHFLNCTSFGKTSQSALLYQSSLQIVVVTCIALHITAAAIQSHAGRLMSRCCVL